MILKSENRKRDEIGCCFDILHATFVLLTSSFPMQPAPICKAFGIMQNHIPRTTGFANMRSRLIVCKGKYPPSPATFARIPTKAVFLLKTVLRSMMIDVSSNAEDTKMKLSLKAVCKNIVSSVCPAAMNAALCASVVAAAY